MYVIFIYLSVCSIVASAVDSVDGVTFRGNWHSSMAPLQFHHDSGSLVLRLDTVPTTLPYCFYVQGLLLIRDGQYADDVDMRFRLRGVFLSTQQEVLLFTQEYWQRDPLLVNNTTPEIQAALTVTEEKILQSHSLRKDSDTTLSRCDLTMHFFVSSNNNADDNEDDGPRYAITATTNLSKVVNKYIRVPPINTNRSSFTQAQGNLSSSQCHFELEVNVSSDTNSHFAKGVHYCNVGILLVCLQVYHTAKQMKFASTQSSATQVAVFTIYLQALLDAYIYFFHIVLAIVVEPIRSNFVAYAFCNFVLFSLVEMRFLFLLWKTQALAEFPLGGDSMHRQFGLRYVCFYGSLVFGFFMMQWPLLLRLAVMVLSSLWVPQIIHNVRYDLKRPLLPSYIIVISATRLFLPLYLWGCPDNFFNVAPDPGLCVALVSYVSLQAAILLLQILCGPRFMIPERFLPVKYKYHRPIPLKRIEISSSNNNNSEGNSNTNTTTKNKEEEAEEEEEPCAICYNEFGAQPAKESIMVTPCDHVFHTECLLRWMEQKMQCPICRFGPLPVP